MPERADHVEPDPQNDFTADELSTSKLLEIYYKRMSETAEEPQSVPTCQVDALINQMEHFNLKSAVLSKESLDTAQKNTVDSSQNSTPTQNQHVRELDVAPPSASCTCKPAIRAPKGLASSRFASESASLSSAGNFTLYANIQVHGPTCALVGSSKVSSSSDREHKPAFAYK